MDKISPPEFVKVLKEVHEGTYFIQIEYRYDERGRQEDSLFPGGTVNYRLPTDVLRSTFPERTCKHPYPECKYNSIFPEHFNFENIYWFQMGNVSFDEQHNITGVEGYDWEPWALVEPLYETWRRVELME